MSTALPNPTAPAPHPLDTLRAELDRIDDALHDLLMRRSDVVTQVASLRAKGGVALRPGREAAIMRRLLARNRGALDVSTLLRVWRDILNGSTAQQEAMRIVASPGLAPLARDHFGAQAAIADMDEREAIDAVAQGNASVAVLRWPGQWWTHLAQKRAATVHVVARLPFWGTRDVEAMVLTAAQADPSGDDRTLLIAPAEADAFETALTAAGHRLTGSLRKADGWTLAELFGFVTAAVPGAQIVGAYAVPVGGAL